MTYKKNKPIPPVARRIIRRIVDEYDPIKVILYGSYARGEQHADSDLDLLIIKETSKRPIERWMEVKRMVRDRNGSISVSPLVYTPKEFQECLDMKDYFIHDILDTGQVLHG